MAVPGVGRDGNLEALGAGTLVVLVRSRAVAFGLVAETAPGVDQAVARIEPDDLVVVGDGAVELALEVIGAASVGIGESEARIELDGLAVPGDGAVIVAL